MTETLNYWVNNEWKESAFPGWADTPASKLIQVFSRMKSLLDTHCKELTTILCKKQGKIRAEGMDDVLKAIEMVKFACGMPHLMKGSSHFNVSNGYDTVQNFRSLSIFVGSTEVGKHIYSTVAAHGERV